MADCTTHKIEKGPLWTRRVRAARAVAAYDLAVIQMQREAQEWADEVRQHAGCPEGCEGPSNFQYSAEELKVYGRYDRPTGEYVFWIKVKFHAKWDCDPLRPEPVELPGITVGPGPIVPPTGGTVTVVTPDDNPCTVTVALTQDNSRRTTPGVFDWIIDVRFEATATNQTHYFEPGKTRVVRVLFAQRGRFGVLGRFLREVKDVSRFLTIDNGSDEATVSGTLFRNPRLNLMPGVKLKFIVESADIKGQHDRREFIISPR